MLLALSLFQNCQAESGPKASASEYDASGTISNMEPGETKDFPFKVGGWEGEIQITWNTNDPDLLLSIEIDGAVVDQAASGSRTYPNPNAPETTEGTVTLRNINAQVIPEVTYEFKVIGAAAEGTSSNFEEAPVIGAGGIVFIVIWLAISGLAVASFKLPKKLALVGLIGCTAMTSVYYIVFFAGGITEGSSFRMNENDLLIIHASITFQYDDPETTGFGLRIWSVEDDVIVFDGSFQISSIQAGEKSETRSLSLPADTYYYELYEIDMTSIDRYTVDIRKQGISGDLGPGYIRGVHIAFAAFSIAGILTTILRIRKEE